MSAALTQAEDRNAKVRAVLAGSFRPLGPTEIARRIGEPWCVYQGREGGYPQSAPITPILRRIGAVGVKGKWSLAVPK